MHATEGTWRTGSRKAEVNQWIDRAALASICIAIAIGCFLALRRAAVATTFPLPPFSLVLPAVGITAWAICIRVAWRPRTNPRTGAVLTQHWLPAIAIVLLAVACSYPGSRFIDWLTWATVAIVFSTSATLFEFARSRLPLSASTARVEVADSDQQLQQLTRYRRPDGGQAIHGKLVAEFEPGERLTTLYVGFCPPFERLPEIDIEVADESFADVKLAQVLHNGAQVDVRLPQASGDKRCVTVELVATEA